MIVFGQVKGWTTFTRFGHNTDLGTSIEDIWSAGGVYSFPTSASTLEVLSDSTNDTNTAGSGARTVTIQGLDASWVEIEETVDLDGTTPVPTTALFLRVNRAFVTTTGTYGTGSDGDITIRISGAGATQALILETSADTVAWDYGQTQLGRYSIPAGKQAFLDTLQVGCESNKRADVTVFQRQGGDTVTAPFTSRRVVKSFEGINTYVETNYRAPLVFPEKTDIIVQARLSNGANGRVNVTYTMFIGPT